MKKYERLTERNENGVAIYKQKCNADDAYENFYIQLQREDSVLNRLAELEDKIERGELVENTVVTYVNMGRCNSKTLIDKALKFDELKAKLENGTLIELPCKVGDTVWLIENYNILELNCFGFVINEDSKSITAYIKEPFFIRQINLRYFNETVFLTKAEAENKLKELKGEV